MEGDEQLLTSAIDLFLRTEAKLVGQVRAAVAARDCVAVEHTAHAYKGAVGNFTTGAVFSSALRLEMIGRSKELSQVQPALVDFEKHVGQLREELIRVRGKGAS